MAISLQHVLVDNGFTSTEIAHHYMGCKDKQEPRRQVVVSIVTCVKRLIYEYRLYGSKVHRHLMQ